MVLVVTRGMIDAGIGKGGALYGIFFGKLVTDCICVSFSVYFCTELSCYIVEILGELFMWVVGGIAG